MTYMRRPKSSFLVFVVVGSASASGQIILVDLAAGSGFTVSRPSRKLRVHLASSKGYRGCPTTNTPRFQRAVRVTPPDAASRRHRGSFPVDVLPQCLGFIRANILSTNA